MTGTAELHTEHADVSRMLRVLEAMGERVEAGERVPAEHFTDAVEFLRVFVDDCHHGKEEQVLFPRILAENVTNAEEVVRDLLIDHVKGRESVARIAQTSERHSGGDEAVSAQLVDAISGYTTLLRQHIRREENDCFRVADEELSADVQDELNQGYERIEEDVVGGGRHEALMATLDRLSDAYAVGVVH